MLRNCTIILSCSFFPLLVFIQLKSHPSYFYVGSSLLHDIKIHQYFHPTTPITSYSIYYRAFHHFPISFFTTKKSRKSFKSLVPSPQKLTITKNRIASALTTFITTDYSTQQFSTELVLSPPQLSAQTSLSLCHTNHLSCCVATSARALSFLFHPPPSVQSI